jgi:hypothetical protein
LPDDTSDDTHAGSGRESTTHPARCTARQGVGSHADATTMECAVPVG